MTTWWWVRHGPTHRKDMIGWTDAPADLTDTDRLSALKTFLPSGAPVVSSDLIRAVDTASGFQGTRHRLPHTPNLREIHFGDWEARHFADIDQTDGALIRQFWETPGAVRAPNGESWDDLCSRVNGFVDRMAHHKHVIAVAHMGVILTQVQRARGVGAYDALGQKIENFSVTKLRLDGATARAELINHHP
ncbi:histidine phosphatase family protein [Cochlodiniinecator piscidefendens]|uniref:histidine phosphatase family protein n=1 Tax=Cochlodiniinecator piscidefendens TaxID=2715756 RepID=UPI00140D30CB|nr:histidine phosphatase family protein [Cochlodiniinecator piscidefendens]